MGFVQKSAEVDDLTTDFDRLIQHCRELIARLGKRTRIESTKLGHYRREMKKLSGLSATEAAKLLGVVRKYCAINAVFDAPNQFKITDEQLFELVKGSSTVDDENEGYNDKFFEVALAARLAVAMGKTALIDLSTACDLICDDFAIECKYVHSVSSLRELFGKGMDQLQARFDASLAKEGLVALDVSNVLDKQRIEAFFQYTFDLFRENYGHIAAGDGSFAEHFKNEGISTRITNDRNFVGIVRNFISHEMETVVCGTLTQGDVNKLDDKRLGIFFQSTQYFCVEYDKGRLPILCRGATYRTSPVLSDKAKEKLVQQIHSWAVGF